MFGKWFGVCVSLPAPYQLDNEDNAAKRSVGVTNTVNGAGGSVRVRHCKVKEGEVEWPGSHCVRMSRDSVEYRSKVQNCWESFQVFNTIKMG